MKKLCQTAAATLILFAVSVGPSTVYAKAGTQEKLFACSLGRKLISVTAVGSRLTYHFGTSAKEEMVIVGTPGQGNVFYRSDLYTGMEYQIRFAKGLYSYVVYSMEGNDRTGMAATSGLTVMKGAKSIADMPCRRHTTFNTNFDYHTLPQDDEDHSAM